MINFTEAENQIITSLAWFRTRYALFLDLDLHRKANKNNIEKFGEVWIGNFKCNWKDSFDTLVKKGVLIFSQDEYEFTPKGELIKKEIESKIPFFKYEYDHFFDTEKKSLAHSKFCKLVYGKNLSQHGLIDLQELSILIEKLNIQRPESVVDIGCGNGKITEFIAGKVNATFTGIDISTVGITSANKRTEGNALIQFKEGNLNNLDFSKEYDTILFLDTLYYAADLKNTILTSVNNLAKNGRLFAYYSQWIMDDSYSENLKPNNTHLAKIFRNFDLDFLYTDLTNSGINHWKKKLKVLEEMKNDFVNEGNIGLWEYRYREALRYANWGNNKYARYLYEVRK
ncbi:MAG: class I SAM-dependent methyltransferase [Bacteroidetes bacterium]|nr:class I SAM-dependent methyltransferase [Bacteroidota bacterium]